MFLELGRARLVVPRPARRSWMPVHATRRLPNVDWEHQTVNTMSTGSLKLSRHQNRWSLTGRGGRVDWDVTSRRLQTRVGAGFWLRQALRLVDLTTRVAAEALPGHASAITDGRQVWILAGLSGAGKTTASRLAHSRGWKVLQDDLVFLQEGHLESAVDWARPHMAKSNRASLPVSGIALLRQSLCDRLTPLSRTEALRDLGPIWGPPPGLPMTTWLERLDREVMCVPVFRLEFRRHAGFVELLRAR